MAHRRLWSRSSLGVTFLFLASFLVPIKGAGEILRPTTPVVLGEESPAAEVSLRIETRPSVNGFSRTQGRQVDTIVLHSCYNPERGDRYSVDAILRIFARERVSAHYLIDRDGRVYQLVAEGDIAHHAGQSRWQGRVGVNRFSIGIELLNHTEDRYTEAQYQSLERLIRNIEGRHPIRFLLAHGEVASERRSDPWNFDWSRVSRIRNRIPETRLTPPVVE